jgi:hypothetical protein
MDLAYLLVLQAAASAQSPQIPRGATPRPAIRFDLRNLPQPSGCAGAGPDEILVCGRRDDSVYRIGEPLPDEDRLALPEAETRLFGNVSGRVYLEQVELQQGLQSRRVMFGIRLPF